MRAFTIATPEYIELARITAACFEWATGLAPTVVTDVADAYEAKLQLPDDEPYVYFDADILFRKQWAIPEVPLGTFAAAPLQFPDRGLREIAKRHELPKPMLSTGLFVASREHAPVMARALELMRAPNESSAHEETWLNVALKELAVPVLMLPQDVNSQKHTSVYATGMHFCMERGATAKCAAVRYNLEHHAPDELRAYLLDRGVGNFVRPTLTGPRAFSAGRRPPGAAPVRESNFAKSRSNGLAKVVSTHRAAPTVGVVEPVDVPKLVGQSVDQQDGVAAAGIAIEDGPALGVQDDRADKPRGSNRALRGRKNA
jgi:hypothetical protein